MPEPKGMGGPKASGVPGAAALSADPNRKHIPAALFREEITELADEYERMQGVFREKITELADEYERMQTDFRRLLQQRADGLIGEPADDESAREPPRAASGALLGLSRVAPALGDGALATEPSDEASDAPSEEGKPRAEPQEEHALNPRTGLGDTPLPVFDGVLSSQCGQGERNEAVQRASSFIATLSSCAAPTPMQTVNSPGSRHVAFQDRPSHNWRTQPFLSVAHSIVFERFIGLTIVLNVIFLGVATDMSVSLAMDGSSADMPASMQITEAVFLGIYTIELVIRLLAFGKNYFLDEHEKLWNIFDMALVVQGVLEQLSSRLRAGPLTGAGNLSYLRALRLVKTVKMLRVVRLMRSMKELRMIIYAVMGSVKSMMWSLVLLGVVLYMMSLICLQGVLGHLQAAGVDGTEDGTFDDIVKYWGSVHTGMLTLFMSSTGGINWDRAFESLSQTGLAFGIIFLAYLSFFMFVIMNTITSLFVEAVLEHASNDWLSRIQEQLENKQAYVVTLRKLFAEMDETHDGVVSLDEFARQLDDPNVCAFFASLGIKIQDAARFFNMLSQNGTMTVDLERFVDVCIRMSGPAQAIDLAEVSIAQCILQRDLRDAREVQEARLDAIARMWGEVMDHASVGDRPKSEHPVHVLEPLHDM